MPLSDFILCELQNFKHDLKSFDCGDADLNEFLHDKSIAHEAELMARTFLFHNGNNSIVAFFAISNDTLADKGEKTSMWNRISRKVTNAKRKRSYPATKIGRLGVSNTYQKAGLGKEIIKFIIGMVLIENKSASRFLIVDAYNKPDVLRFYSGNGFQFLLESDGPNETRIMFLDLLPYVEALRSA